MSAVALRQDGEAQRLPVTHPVQAVSESTAIVQMIERAASNPAVDIEKMERLLDMQERVLNRRSREAYSTAFAAMQSDLPTIRERGVGDKKMKYALWEDVNDAIKPVLAKHGFGISFKTGRTTDRVTVTAILMHRDGHSEETTLELPVDTSGSKNAVQAVGSSTSYGKRYTAGAILNLTSRDGVEADDDGKAANADTTIDDAQLKELRRVMAEVRSDEPRFLEFFCIERVEDLSAAKFDGAIRMLRQKAARQNGAGSREAGR